MRLTLGTRLGIGYGVVSAALLVVFVLTIGAFEATRRHSANIRQNLLPNIQASNTMLLALEQMENAEFLYFTPREAPTRHYRTFDAQEARFRSALRAAEALSESPRRQEAVARASEQFGAFVHVEHRIRRLLATGQVDAARQLNVTESLALADDVRRSVRRFRDLNLQAILAEQAQEEQLLRWSEWIAGGISLLALVLAVLIWRRTVQAVVAPLQNLEAAAGALASGRFLSAHHPEAERTGEIAALQHDFNAMAKQLEGMTRGLEAQVQARTHELQSAKEQLEKLVVELRTLDKMKSDLMAVVSHELLTPINFIMAYGSTLEEEVLGPLGPDQVAAARGIVEGARRLTRMVRNVLDYTQLASGRLAIRPEEVDYAPLVRDVADMMRPSIEAKSQELEVSIPPELPYVWADPVRVGQVLQELLDNAVKFTSERGRLRVVVSHDADVVRTSVSDSGIGMPADIQANLFKGFYQADATSTRAYGGLGLGLAITHHLVSHMGGTITVHSTPGGGSTFAFTLPRADRRAS